MDKWREEEERERMEGREECRRENGRKRRMSERGGKERLSEMLNVIQTYYLCLRISSFIPFVYTI